MAEELQHLIDKIRKEGVDAAKSEADGLVAKAKKDAADIVAKAKKDAADIVAKAEKDAAAFADRGAKTLEQAARDLLISIGGAVSNVISGMVDEKVGAALTPDTMAQMLIKIADAYAQKGGEGDLVAFLGEADAAALKGGIAKEYQDKLAAGKLQVESDRGIFKGFCVGRKGGQVMHDFSRDAIAESLANFLRPDLADVVKKASAK